VSGERWRNRFALATRSLAVVAPIVPMVVDHRLLPRARGAQVDGPAIIECPIGGLRRGGRLPTHLNICCPNVHSSETYPDTAPDTQTGAPIQKSLLSQCVTECRSGQGNARVSYCSVRAVWRSNRYRGLL
jgi:hypothetical protein